MHKQSVIEIIVDESNMLLVTPAGAEPLTLPCFNCSALCLSHWLIKAVKTFPFTLFSPFADHGSIDTREHERFPDKPGNMITKPHDVLLPCGLEQESGREALENI